MYSRLTESLKHEQLRLAPHAKTLLQDEALELTLDLLRLRYAAQWEMAQNVEDRERLWQKIHLIADFKAELQAAVNTGTMAKKPGGI